MTLDLMVRSGGVTFVLDTNVACATHRVLKVCTAVARLNEAPRSLGLRVCVPAVVHMEMLHDIRGRKREKEQPFDPKMIERSLEARGIAVLDFDREHAERAAAWLDSLFPTNDAWREAKRTQCVAQLGLRPDYAPGKRCSATVDWLIASHTWPTEIILITEDSGQEFCRVDRKMGLNELERLLDALLAA